MLEQSQIQPQPWAPRRVKRLDPLQTAEIKSEGVPIRLMLVDSDLEEQNQVMAELFTAGLSNYVEYVSSGKEAIRHLRRSGTQLPEVILLEMYLPDLHGRHVLRWVKQRFPEIDVIALTHFASEAFVRRVYEDGVSCFIRKPFTVQGLLAALGQMQPGKYGITLTRTELCG